MSGCKHCFPVKPCLLQPPGTNRGMMSIDIERMAKAGKPCPTAGYCPGRGPLRNNTVQQHGKDLIESPHIPPLPPDIMQQAGTEQERKVQSGQTLLFRQSHRCPGNTQRMALIRQGHAPKKRLDLFRQMFRNKTTVSCRKLRPNGLKKLPYPLHHEMYSRLV